MIDRPSLNSVKKEIVDLYTRRRAAVYALALLWAARTIREFRQRQANNYYWNNETTTAWRTMFTTAFIDGDMIGFLMAHAISYGVYLELANNGRNQAIRPLMQAFSVFFISDVRRLYEG
jgi:hypothetical protein